MRLLIFALLLLAASVGLALMAREDPGYLLLAYDRWAVETTLITALVLIVAATTAVVLLLRLLHLLTSLPRRLEQWLRRRRQQRARRLSSDGLVALAEGRWKVAERQLARSARNSDTPLLNYLSAARAAQEQHADERRDRYLRLAHDSTPGADMAVELTQAELQMHEGQLEQALATLNHLRSLVPGHPYVLRQLTELYQRLRGWEELHRLLPELRRHAVLPTAELNRIASRVYGSLMRLAGQAGDAGRLEALWQEAGNDLRLREEIQFEFVRQLYNSRSMDRAEQACREAIQQGWSDRLVQLYGFVEGRDARQQLAHAETWLRSHEQNPVLLLTCARLCQRNGLWGKARGYLERSLAVRPSAEAYQQSAALFEQLGDTERANTLCRQGLHLAARQIEQAALGINP